MQKLTLILLILVGMAGCDKLQRVNETMAELTNKAVIKYCKAPKETRLALHAEVKKSVAPNEITISCGEDVKPS